LRKRKKPVLVELVGGIGNQLFGYFAAAYLKECKGLEVSPYFLPNRTLARDKTFSVTSFSLPIPIKQKLPKVMKVDLLGRLILRRTLELVGLSRQFAEKVSRVHSATSLGVDRRLIHTQPGWFVQGYFQTFDYHQSLRDREVPADLELIDPSDWYLGMSKTMISERPIVLHIRRGDYLKRINHDIGALSLEYFNKALQTLTELEGLNNRPIWVFSDDVAFVKGEFRNQDTSGFVWVQPPQDSDPAESMLLMSKASSIVISNSSFAWWAARVGPKSNVYAPTKWFKKIADPEGLIPSTWVRVESSWL
jgi:hypothetical protein